MKENEVQYLLNNKEIIATPLIPFSEIVICFLDDLSKLLRRDMEAKGYSDIQTFAYWIRKSHIIELRNQFDRSAVRLGRGTVFHIAPSNVPINFAYSLVFGMLAGNANIVRVSSKKFPQVDIICRNIEALLSERYKSLQKTLVIIKYKINKEITDDFSARCNARVIWGGDHTISEIRKSPIPPRAIDIKFADRYSVGVLNPEAILQLNDKDMRQLAMKFYNDTYLMDQNACSTPHMLFWKKSNGINIEKASKRFWDSVYEIAKEKYSLEAIKASDKFTDLYHVLAINNDIADMKGYENYLYVLKLNAINKALESYRGRYGLFYEYEFEDFKEIAILIDEKVQTCAYFGIDKKEILEMIVNNGIKGIDRIVPFGETLNIGVIWDGYNIIQSLSRIIV